MERPPLTDQGTYSSWPVLPAVSPEPLLEYLHYELANQVRILRGPPGQEGVIENGGKGVTYAAVVLALGPGGIAKD